MFSDYAVKRRAISVPAGSSAAYAPTGSLDLPVGTRLIKSFLFPPDLRSPDAGLKIIETRILERTAGGWEVSPYVWRADGSDAELKTGGEVRDISFIDRQGKSRTAHYLIPQKNQCLSCHQQLDSSNSPVTGIIGPKVRHLNRDFPYASGSENQLAHWAAAGILTGVPTDLDAEPRAFDESAWENNDPSTLAPAEVERAARDYLEINCAHCHNPRGVQGVTSQLFLNQDNHDDFHLGVCKQPGSAGLGGGGLHFDIVPGDPDSSILHYRMATEDVGAMMPLLGRSLEHKEAVALIRAFISGMPAQTCQ